MAGKETRKPKKKNPNEQKMAMKAYKRAVSNRPKARKQKKDVKKVASLQAKPLKEKKATKTALQVGTKKATKTALQVGTKTATKSTMQRSQGTMQGSMQRTQRSYNPHVDMKVRDNVANVTYPVVNGVSRKTTGKEVKGNLRKRYYRAD